MTLQRPRHGLPFWLVLTVGALFVTLSVAADTAQATVLWSGLFTSTKDSTHCSVVNTGPQNLKNIRIEIRFGQDNTLCNAETRDIDIAKARGVNCDGPAGGTYCRVLGFFQPGDVRAVFTYRNGFGDQAVIELR